MASVFECVPTPLLLALHPWVYLVHSEIAGELLSNQTMQLAWDTCLSNPFTITKWISANSESASIRPSFQSSWAQPERDVLWEI